MKIRNGFVSNSSTSSFCVFGVISEGIEEDYDDDKDMDASEELEEKASSAGLEVHRTPDGDQYVIGISARKLPMDKTLNEMVIIISKKLKSIGIKFDKIGWHEEAWSDG